MVERIKPIPVLTPSELQSEQLWCEQLLNKNRSQRPIRPSFPIDKIRAERDEVAIDNTSSQISNNPNQISYK